MQKVEICGVDTSGLPKLTAKENEELMIRLKQGGRVEMSMRKPSIFYTCVIFKGA